MWEMFWIIFLLFFFEFSSLDFDKHMWLCFEILDKRKNTFNTVRPIKFMNWVDYKWDKSYEMYEYKRGLRINSMLNGLVFYCLYRRQPLPAHPFFFFYLLHIDHTSRNALILLAPNGSHMHTLPLLSYHQAELT